MGAVEVAVRDLQVTVAQERQWVLLLVILMVMTEEQTGVAEMAGKALVNLQRMIVCRRPVWASLPSPWAL